ncbi:hypothetical protein RND81_06G035900 [Saponaria officinalis]|uniref:GTP-binding protein n=1 Tax=Saponaria officinalis TaxID=3572 RepID=A0AAW1K9C8_SAPOF
MGGMVSSLTTTIYGKKRLPILMIGYGFAGKSTILHRLVHGDFIEINTPTIGFDAETVDYKDVSFIVSEVGGQLRGMAALCRHYLGVTPGLIMVVDSGGRDRITDARDKLHDYMKEIEV